MTKTQNSSLVYRTPHYVHLLYNNNGSLFTCLLKQYNPFVTDMCHINKQMATLLEDWTSSWFCQLFFMEGAEFEV